MTGRRVLVLGGARSGKSAYAESLLRGEATVDYLATALGDPHDTEWAGRIAAHRARRPSSWATLESGDVAAVLAAEGGAVLVDSVTAWLARSMDECGVWAGDEQADSALAATVERAVAAWEQTRRHLVAVTDEVGGGIVPDSKSGRRFRDELGALNQRLAAAADEVWLVTAGIPLRLR